MQIDGATALRSLEILGLTEAEESAYRWLVGHSGATAQDLTQALELSSRKVQQLLVMLETKGLATHSPERPRRYIPAAPDIALETLALRRQKDLQDARNAIQKLQEQAADQQHGEQEQMVELITSREAEAQIFDQMHEMAQNEIVILTRPPLRLSDVASERYTQRKARDRGVLSRNIVDAGFLALPGALNRVCNDMRFGEEVRMLTHIPSKVIIADHRIALMPLNLQQPNSPSLLVRSSALLDTLHTLFEVLWQQAVPISFASEGALERGEPDSWLSDETKDLMSLLAAGLNDKNIAHELGVTTRTLQRRVTALMQALGARTRFQLGWLGALRRSAAGSISGIQGSSGK